MSFKGPMYMFSLCFALKYIAFISISSILRFFCEVIDVKIITEINIGVWKTCHKKSILIFLFNVKSFCIQSFLILLLLFVSLSLLSLFFCCGCILFLNQSLNYKFWFQMHFYLFISYYFLNQYIFFVPNKFSFISIELLNLKLSNWWLL